MNCEPNRRGKAAFMRQSSFGKLGSVSALTLGGGGIGMVWGETTFDECVATVHQAVAAGINLIDLAPSYGDGRAERVARIPITPTPRARAAVIIARGFAGPWKNFRPPGESSRLAMHCTAAGAGRSPRSSMIVSG
jgi:aryl-alcohol dehydrogenase-like predicted oxidoreductase